MRMTALLLLAACSDKATTDRVNSDKVITDTSGTDSSGTDSSASPDDSVPNTLECPSEGCPGSSECLATAQSGDPNRFTLRAALMDITRPPTLASGIMNSVIEGAVGMNLTSCGLSGQATWNLLFGFDLAAGTIHLSSAMPVADGVGPWTPLSATIGGFAVSPRAMSGTVDGSGQISGELSSANLAIFLDQAGTRVVVLPLQRITLSGLLSSDHECIGSYNAEELADVDCVVDAAHPAFTSGGTLSGLISLEDADAVVVNEVNESLCVLLSGDPSTYGDGGSPQRCRRDGNQAIQFAGDWCIATNAAATAECSDAMAISFDFTANAVAVAQ